MDEHDKKACDLIADTSKQLMTWSSSIIAVTAVLLKDHAKATPADPWAAGLILISWLAFLVSVGFGVYVLNDLSGRLINARQDHSVLEDPASLARDLHRQLLAFGAGAGLMVAFGARVVLWPSLT